MSLDYHTLTAIPGGAPSQSDRVAIGIFPDVPNVAGAAAGDTVVTSVALNGNVPPNYSVAVTPNQAAFVSVTNKTATGFDVTLTPTVSTATIAAGTFDVVVFG